MVRDDGQVENRAIGGKSATATDCDEASAPRDAGRLLSEVRFTGSITAAALKAGALRGNAKHASAWLMRAGAATLGVATAVGTLSLQAHAGIRYEAAATQVLTQAPTQAPAGAEHSEALGGFTLGGDFNGDSGGKGPGETGDTSFRASANAPRMRSMISPDISQLRWEKSFGGDRSDAFNDVVVRRTDFAVIAAGYTMSQSAGRKDSWVVAVDADGAPLWDRSFGGALDEEANALIDLSDGSIVVAGSEATGTAGGGGIVTRIDQQGSETWSYRYDSPGVDSFNAITQLASGDIIVAGRGETTKTVVTRLTPEGEPVWEKLFSEGVPQSVSAIVNLKSGDLVLIGESTELFDSNAIAARVSSRGDLVWEKSFGGPDNDSFADAVVLPDGDVFAVGARGLNGNSDGWVVRIGSDGVQRWEKTFGGITRDYLNAVVLRADLSLVAAGVRAAGEVEENNSWLIELSSDGDLGKVQTYGGKFKESVRGLSARADGSLVAVGMRQNWSDEPANAFTATIGRPIERFVMRGDGATDINPPVVFMPGEGKILTDKASVEVLGNVIHGKPIRQLFVDGRPSSLLHNGAFTMRISVPLGTTRLKVEAVDIDGALGTAEVMVTRVEADSLGTMNLAALREQIQFGNYHAIVIGNNQYSGELPNLETAAKDAEAIAATLKSDFGFDVQLLLNAKRDDIISAIEAKSDSLRDDDNLLIYYAGHGYYDEDVDLGYWLPTDASLSKKDNWIRNSTITDSIKSMQAKHVMLVADSCFSGTLLRSAEPRRTGRFYAQMANRSARLVMTSGGVEPVMDGGGDGHSVFARSFLNKLQSGEEVIDGTSLFQSIREPVVLSSQQVPQYSNIRFVESDGGDFLFVRSALD